MKLIHCDLDTDIINSNYQHCEWIIESPELFSKYVLELYKQTEAEEGNFVLSEQDKELDIAKYVEIISDPLSINLNDKKILNKLYSELSKNAYAEECYLHTQEVLSALQKYFAFLETSSNYFLEDDEEPDIIAIFKALNVKLSVYSENLFELLWQYIKATSELLKKKLIVFVNIRSYLTQEQVIELIKNADYNEISLLLIENCQKGCPTDSVHYIIIDKDGCEI